MDDSHGSINLILMIVGVLLLLTIQFFYTLSKTAFTCIKDKEILEKAQNGDQKAQKVMLLLKNSHLFSSALFYATLTAINFIVAILVFNIAPVLKTSVTKLIPQISPIYSDIFSIIIIVPISSFLIYIFGYLIPERLATHNPEKIAYLLYLPTKITVSFYKLTIKLAFFLINCVCRIFKIDIMKAEKIVTEEDIRMLVDVGEEKGVIENEQREMINNVFEFDDILAGEVMTHRTDIVATEKDTPLKQIVELSIEEGYSRIPVYEDTIDNIIGIVYIKDLNKYIFSTLPKKENAESVMRNAIYLPQTLSCSKTFEEMKENNVKMAIVVDEYGGTAGLITMEDLVEYIVGDIHDEYDKEEPDFYKKDASNYILSGQMPVEDLEKICETRFPEDYDTVGGFISFLLGYVPKNGDLNKVRYENFEFTVLKVKGRRIEKIRLTILPNESNEKDED